MVVKHSKPTELNFFRKFSLAWKQAKRPKMAQFVHLFVTTTFFWGLSHWFCFIFFMKLRDHKYSKLTELNFLGNFSLIWKQAKRPEIAWLVFLSIYGNTFFRIGSLVFFIFCMKLRYHKYWKLTELIFFGKFLPAQKWARKAQNGPIFVFVRYDSIFLRIGPLVFFYILDEVEGPQVLKTDVAEFFGKILACSKVGQKGPKWPDFYVCPLRQHFSQDWLISFFIYFARSWGP